ncbi:hypothetical protein LB504_009218 [Fusarium proliferatum]|nr:hypothetical protein LB504_009218 [Fusarium proliferatum]
MCGTDNASAAAPVPHPASTAHLPSSSPYSQVQDFISQTQSYQIIESTLREGEQFANAFFTREQKVKIATMLSEFGCQYIELTSPVSSQASYDDCKYICSLGLKAKILTHVRCNMEDAKRAVLTVTAMENPWLSSRKRMCPFLRPADGIVILTEFPRALEVIEYVKSKGVEVRFSSEDSFRSDLVDILSLYQAVDKAGVNRVGIADTVGGATPRMVYDLVRTLRGGATHVDTSVLGIGERNGITPLGALMARMVVTAPEYTKKTFDLPRLKTIEEYVASVVEINIPFNNPVTGFCAFTHKAGIHAKAILANPSTYEIIDPALFGLTRYVNITSRITGWNAVKGRITQLGLDGPGGFETDDQIKEVSSNWLTHVPFPLGSMTRIRPLAIDDADSIIHAYHLQLTGNSKQQETAA